MQEFLGPLRGRGASSNPTNRFETIHYEPIDYEPVEGEEGPAPQTQFLRDRTRSIIATNDSPDVRFDASINPYRGCEHGCIYCYARNFHDYLGFSPGLDFETKILVKEDAPELLRQELSSKRWQPRTLGLSGVTDPYQPVERRLQITRRCLEVLAEFRNPVIAVSKNHLITRDRDILAQLAQHGAAGVAVAVTTLDDDLVGVMEPRTTRPQGRLQAIRELTEAGIPTSVLIAPVIPGLTDHELPAILAAARQAGAVDASWVLLRLAGALAEIFPRWLEQRFPERKDKVLSRVRATRGGKIYQSGFENRMKGDGEIADMIGKLFTVAYRKENFPGWRPLSTAAFRRPNDTPSLFGEE